MILLLIITFHHSGNKEIWLKHPKKYLRQQRNMVKAPQGISRQESLCSGGKTTRWLQSLWLYLPVLLNTIDIVDVVFSTCTKPNPITGRCPPNSQTPCSITYPSVQSTLISCRNWQTSPWWWQGMVEGCTVFSKQVSIILTLQAESSIILTCVAKHNRHRMSRWCLSPMPNLHIPDHKHTYLKDIARLGNRMKRGAASETIQLAPVNYLAHCQFCSSWSWT